MNSRAAANRQNRRAQQLLHTIHGHTPPHIDYRDWGPLDRKIPGEQLLPRTDPAEHGTPSGYRQHIRHKTPPCATCLDAHRIDNNLRKQTA